MESGDDSRNIPEQSTTSLDNPMNYEPLKTQNAELDTESLIPVFIASSCMRWVDDQNDAK